MFLLEPNITYMGSRFQGLGLHRVLMESGPFFKGLLRRSLVLFVIPVQHVGCVLFPNALTESLNYSGWVVKQVICVDDTYLNGLVDFGAIGSVITVGRRRSICVIRCISATGTMRSNHLDFTKEVEESAELFVAGFRFVKLIEARQFIQRRDRASVEGRDTVMWVADQKDEMEF